MSRRAIRDLLSARALGVMHGPAGSGKTFAAELAVAEFKVERAWVQFPSRPTMLHVARRLYRELTGADPGASEPVRALRGADRPARGPRVAAGRR